MKSIIYITILFLAAGLSAHAQDKVVAHTKRSNLLKTAELYSNVGSLTIKSEIDYGVRYPFEFAPKVEAPPPPPPGDDGIIKPPPPPPVIELTDDEVLAKLAPRLRPTGSMVVRGKGVLTLPQGPLPEGSTIKVTLNNKPYIISVINITADSYTLKLNDATLPRAIDPSANSVGIKRDN